MQALILAAGIGSRLGSLTNNKPKALVEVAGRPLIEHQLFRLYGMGFRHIVVNVHHHARQLVDYLQGCDYPGLRIDISDESQCLLNTGGGILNAWHFFDQKKAVLVHNVDILGNIDVGSLYSSFLKDKPMALLAVRKRKSSRYLLFNEKGLLSGWKNIKSGELIYCRNDALAINPMAFSGVYFLNPEFACQAQKQKCIPLNENSFSIIDILLCLAKNHDIKAWDHTKDVWMDVGSPEKLSEAENYFKGLNTNL